MDVRIYMYTIALLSVIGKQLRPKLMYRRNSTPNGNIRSLFPRPFPTSSSEFTAIKGVKPRTPICYSFNHTTGMVLSFPAYNRNRGGYESLIRDREIRNCELQTSAISLLPVSVSSPHYISANLSHRHHRNGKAHRRANFQSKYFYQWF